MTSLDVAYAIGELNALHKAEIAKLETRAAEWDALAERLQTERNAAQGELTTARAWIELLEAQLAELRAAPKCGRCGKRQVSDIHTCAPTAYARRREADIVELVSALRPFCEPEPLKEGQMQYAKHILAKHEARR